MIDIYSLYSNFHKMYISTRHNNKKLCVPLMKELPIMQLFFQEYALYQCTTYVYCIVLNIKCWYRQSLHNQNEIIINFRCFCAPQSQFESKYVGHGHNDSPRHVRHELRSERHVKCYSHVRLREWTV